MSIHFFKTVSKTDKNAWDITGCTAGARHLLIPSELEGRPVASIARGAFRGRQDLHSVRLEEGIRTIDIEAFADCKNLRCAALADSIDRISTQAFYGCTALETLEAPAQLRRIERQAFYGCVSLECVTLHNRVEHLGSLAFAGCEGLRELQMACVPLYVGEDCFAGAKRLISSDGNLQTVDGRLLLRYLGEEPVVRLPEGIEVIAFGAFRGRFFLQQVIAGENLKSIGAYAFEKCSNLRAVLNVGAVRRIFDHAFADCARLRELPAGEAAEGLGAHAFVGCRALERLCLPAGLSEIPVGAFADCSSAAQIYLPEKLRRLGAHAFENCSALERLVLPDSLTEIGSYAFAGCSSLAELTLPSALETIGERAFQKCEELHRIDAAAWDYPMGCLGEGVRLTLTLPSQASRLRLFFADDLSLFVQGGRAGLALALQDAAQELSLAEYDACMELLRGRRDRLLFALNRLRAPVGLSADRENVFRSYLRAHAAEAVCLCAGQRDPEGVRLLCEEELLDEAQLEEAIDRMNELGESSVLAVLMNQKQASDGADALDKLFAL